MEILPHKIFALSLLYLNVDTTEDQDRKMERVINKKISRRKAKTLNSCLCRLRG